MNKIITLTLIIMAALLCALYYFLYYQQSKAYRHKPSIDVQSMQKKETNKDKVTANLVLSSHEVDVKQSKVIKIQSEFPEADSFEGLLAKVKSEQAEYYRHLNGSLYGLLEFYNKQSFEQIRYNGLPTPKEAEYIYSNNVKTLISDAEYMIDMDYNGNEISRFSSLALNKAIDEFVEVYKFYYPEYQYGNDIKGLINNSWPMELQQKANDVLKLSSFNQGSSAVSLMSSIRFRELSHIAVGDHKATIKAKLSSIKEKLPQWNTSNYLDTWGWVNDGFHRPKS